MPLAPPVIKIVLLLSFIITYLLNYGTIDKVARKLSAARHKHNAPRMHGETARHSACGAVGLASRTEELSDARHGNRSDPQAGKISPRTRRRRRLAPSARLHRLRLHSRPHRTLGAGAGTAKRRVAPKPGGEFQRCSPLCVPKTLSELMT